MMDVNINVQHSLVVSEGVKQAHEASVKVQDRKKFPLLNTVKQRQSTGTHRTAKHSTASEAESNSLQQFKDGKDDVIDVTEARSLGLLGVVKTSGPVDGDVSLLPIQLHRSGCHADRAEGLFIHGSGITGTACQARDSCVTKHKYLVLDLGGTTITRYTAVF